MKKSIIFGVFVLFILVLSSFAIARPIQANNAELEDPIDAISTLFISWTLYNPEDGTSAGRYYSCTSVPYNRAHFYMKDDPSIYTEPSFTMNTNEVSATASTDNRFLKWEMGDYVYAYMENPGVGGNGCFYPEIEIYINKSPEIRSGQIKCAVLVWEPNITIHDACWMQQPYNYSINATLTSDVMEQIPTIQISSGDSIQLNLSDYNNYSEIIQFPFNISLREGFTDSLNVNTDELTPQSICTSCPDEIKDTANLEISGEQLFEEHNIVFNVSNSTFNRWRKIFFNTEITNLEYSCYSNNSNISVQLYDSDKLNISSILGWQGISTVHCNLTDGNYVNNFEFNIDTNEYDVSVYGLSPVLVDGNLFPGQKSYFRFYVYNNGTKVVDNVDWAFDSNSTQGWIYSSYNLTIQPKQEQVVYLYTTYDYEGQYNPKVYLDYGNNYLEIDEGNNDDSLLIQIKSAKTKINSKTKIN